MNVHVPALGRVFELPRMQLTPFMRAEMDHAFPALCGRRLAVDYQDDIDRPETAARLVRERLDEYAFPGCPLSRAVSRARY